MHELSIALAILDAASEEADCRGGGLVSAVHVRLGALSGVVKEALMSAYELAAETSPFPGCRLIIEDVPVVIYCDRCQDDRPIESIQSFRCASCGSPAANVKRGRELEITALEIEE
jgi:hydrogenase nickel incorporation protein HypA/HybF